MKNRMDWIFRRLTGGVGAVALLALTGAAAVQGQEAQMQPSGSRMTVPEGYSSHQTMDVGGHIASVTGSSAMYSTLVNQQSGPRILNQTFTMHALPGSKHGLVDSLSAMSAGLGGDPAAFAKLDFSKGKTYAFSGLFRRNRQYFDYDLLGNPNIPGNLSIPIGSSAAPTSSLTWGPVNHSPELFNTVRRMTDTNLTVLPLSTFSYRFGYAQNTFEGPSLSPSYTILKYNADLEQYQRNSTDDFFGALDWKPAPTTRVSFEERITHYKADSFFTLDPNGYQAQEADGTRVYLGNWNSLTPYGVAACNNAGMGSAYTSSSNYTILSPNNQGGSLPIINAACSAVTSYTRQQPTRIITPTSTLRLQSSALKNVTMNGVVSYTKGNVSMPNYYEDAKGLSTSSTATTSVREITYTGGHAKGNRSVFSVDYGVVWQAAKTFNLADQVDYTYIQEPGQSLIPKPTNLSTPTGGANQTINYSGTLTSSTGTLPHGINGTLTYNFYGQKTTSNLLTASWDALPRARFALSYRFKQERILQGVPHNTPIVAENDPINGYVDITTNGGIFNAAVRPASNWDVNGTAEIAYSDNAFTSVSPRQLQRYRVHTKYRPKSWATLTGAFSDVERHNNTLGSAEAEEIAAGTLVYSGPLDHQDHTRMFGVGGALTPSEHYGLDFNYGYSDVYAATNVCYTSGATAGSSTTAAQAGTASLNAAGAPDICAGATTQWHGRDFQDAPTQYGSVSLMLSPHRNFTSNLGYTVSSVDGTQFFMDARAVAGAMNSTYQSPFVKLDWKLRPGLSWKAEYNFYGYGEGGASGAQYCSTATSAIATITPCADMTLPTGMNAPTSAGYTAARNFHANNVTLALHYEF